MPTRPWPVPPDLALAGGTFALCTVPPLLSGSGHGPTAAVAALGLLAALPPAVRRTRPVPVLVAVALAHAAAAPADVRFTPVERRTRRTLRREPEHRHDAREPAVVQARCPGPGAARGPRVREWTGVARWVNGRRN